MRFSAAAVVFVCSLAGFAQADDVDLVTDKKFYTQGENRLILSVRSWDTLMDFEADFNITVYRGNTVILEDAVTWLPNGEDKSAWSWNLRNRWNRPVSPGTYTINVTFEYENDDHDPGYIMFDNNIDVEVVPQAPSGRIIVRTTKREYASGEKVKFYAINRTSRNRSMPSIAPWKILTAGNVPVFEPVNVFIVPSSLPPRGGRQMWTWDQRSLSGQPVAPGNYKVRVTLGTAQSPEHLYRSFWILADQQ